MTYFFSKSEPEYAYKRYAYKNKIKTCMGFLFYSSTSNFPEDITLETRISDDQPHHCSDSRLRQQLVMLSVIVEGEREITGQ